MIYVGHCQRILPYCQNPMSSSICRKVILCNLGGRLCNATPNIPLMMNLKQMIEFEFKYECIWETLSSLQWPQSDNKIGLRPHCQHFTSNIFKFIMWYGNICLFWLLVKTMAWIWEIRDWTIYHWTDWTIMFWLCAFCLWESLCTLI